MGKHITNSVIYTKKKGEKVVGLSKIGYFGGGEINGQ